MALHLVTGYAGKTHITSADQGALHAAIFGRENYILNVGNCFSASAITSNSVKVLDGEVIMQGRHIRLEPGAYEEVTIENGTQEYFRNDLICIRYTKNADTGIENASFVVIKGTPDASSAVDPGYNKGNILDGILTVDLPLYRVPLNGLNIGNLVPLFETKGCMDERTSALETGKVDKKAGKGLSTNDYSNSEKQQVATNKTDIANLKNGTTPAGNANKLGGKSASEYALAEELDTFIPTHSQGNTEAEIDSIYASFHANVENGTHYVRSISHGYSHSILGGGRFLVEGFRASDEYGWQRTTAYTALGYTATFEREISAATWKPWRKDATTADLANYLPLSGGTATGNITVSKNGADAGIRAKETSNGTEIALEASASGRIGLFDYGNVQWMLCRDTDGKLKVSDATHSFVPLLHTGNVGEYALPLDGSVPMSDSLKVHNTSGKATLYPSGNSTVLQSSDVDATSVRYLQVRSLVDMAVALRLADHTKGIAYDVHHDGNSAKVVVSSTPLTAEGSVRVW